MEVIRRKQAVTPNDETEKTLEDTIKESDVRDEKMWLFAQQNMINHVVEMFDSFLEIKDKCEQIAEEYDVDKKCLWNFVKYTLDIDNPFGTAEEE